MIDERWQKILRQHGDSVALHHAGGALTFAEIEAHAQAVPCAEDHLLARGDAADIMVSLVAGWRAGVPVQVVEKDRMRRVPACPVPPDTSVIKQTVGGSGVRRCQFFSASQILADVDRLHAALRLDQQGICVAAISPAHSYGLTVTVLQTLLHGLPMYWLPEPFPAGLTEALRHHENVFLPGIPALWKAWFMAGVPMDRVTLAVSAGSPLTLELERSGLGQHGIKLHNLYGASECGAVAYDATLTLREDASLLGDLLPGVTAMSDTNGHILVRTDATGFGYDEMLAEEVFSNGAFKPADRLRVQGRALHFDGSTGNGINVAGRKLSPDEIAIKLRSATGVAAVTVRGNPSRDPERCEEVVAVIRVAPDDLTMEFKQRACANLAPWEVPRKWIASGDHDR